MWPSGLGVSPVKKQLWSICLCQALGSQRCVRDSQPTWIGLGGGASEHQPGLKQTQLSGIDVRIETKCAIVRHSVICVLLATAPALSSWPLE